MAVVLWLFADTFAASLYSVDDLAHRAVALWAAGRPIRIASLLPVLGPVDALLALGAMAAAVTLAWMEWRSAALTRLLREGTRGQFALLLGAVLIWLAQYCFVPGVLLGGDTATHITRFFEVSQALAAGHLPLWTNDQYLGSPLLSFTGPLTYLLGGAANVLIGNAMVTGKVFLLATKLLTGIAFYRLLRRFGLARAAGLAGAAGLVGSFSYVHLFLYRGVYPQALTILFLVLLFHAAEGLMTTLRTRAGDWALFALTTAAMIVNHQPHALFAAFYLGIFGLVSLLAGRWHARGLFGLVGAGVVGVITSLFAVIPIITQAGWVMIEPGSAFFRLRLPTLIRLWHLVMWRDTRTTWGTDYWAYLGIVLLVLAVTGALAAVSRRLDPPRRQIAFACLACLPPALVVWNPVVRAIMFILFFVAILGALGVQRLFESGTWRGRAMTLALVALLLDVGSTAVQPVARTDKGFLISAGHAIAAWRPQARVVEMPLGPHGRLHGSVGPNATPMSYVADVERVAGTHNMAATRVHNYAITTVKLAQHDLTMRGRLSTATARLLAMLNVRAVVCWSSEHMGCPVRLSPTADGVLGDVIPVPGPSPVLFAARVVALKPSPRFDKPMLWDADFAPVSHNPVVLGIDRFLHRWEKVTDPGLDGMAAALAVRQLPTNAAISAPGWRAHLVSYHVGLQRVQIRLRTSGPGYAQLAFPDYPGTLVSVNGDQVIPLQGATNLMVLPLPAGALRITLTPVMTVWERVSAAISLFGLLLVAGGVMVLRRRTRP